MVRQADLPPVGAADGKFQFYSFRLCLTDDPANRLPIPKPDNYDPARFGLVRNYLEAGKDQLELRNFLCLSRIPNRKTDINTCGFVSTAPLGPAWEYPEANAQRRQEIWKEHLDWAHGFIYFLQNDPRCRPTSGKPSPLGPGQRRIPGHRPLAPPALHPRGPANVVRVRHDPARPPAASPQV